jgi:hypothetical protein
MSKFTFNGKTVIEPSILVRTIIGRQTALSLLPFGTLCFVGASDGGLGGGTVYRFSDMNTAQRILRGGSLLSALQLAANAGGAADIIAVVACIKTSATLTLSGGILAAGDQGLWTNNVTYTAVPGSTSGFAVTITYPDPISGVTIVVGGVNTAYDNLPLLSSLQAVLLADGVVTPPTTSGFPPIVQLTIVTDGALSAQATVSLSGGTGDGSVTPGFADVKRALDTLDDTAFDIGHLAGIYDIGSQSYANGKAAAHEIYGYLQRWIHQVRVPGVNPANSPAVNSSEIVNTALGVAADMNYYRASVVAQQTLNYDSNSGVFEMVDIAPIACGLAAFIGATDQWGPASPLTHVYLPSGADVDYRVLRSNGDQGRAISAGVMIFETVGIPAPGNVRCVQSVTTQPLDPATGQTWLLSEFSCVRVSDAVLANVKAQIESNSPRSIGGGNTLGTLNSLIADVVDVLELALAASWLTGYDKSSISIGTSGITGSDDLITYSAAPTPPLNHLGVTQTLLPFQARLGA